MPYGGANPAAKGRGGDTELGHLQLGEIVLPVDFREQRPDLYTEIAEFLGGDIGRRTVGGGDDSINPDTGYPEFFGHGRGGEGRGDPPTRSGSGTGVVGGQGGSRGNVYGMGSVGSATGAEGTGGVTGTTGGMGATGAATGGGTVGGPGPSGGQGGPGSGGVPGDDAINAENAVKSLINNIFSTIDPTPHPYSLNLTNITPVAKAKADAAELGHVPNMFSQANIGNVALPEIFGKFQGLIDPYSGEVVSLPQLQAMTPAQFGKFSANPDTGVVGDPNSPFGQAFSGARDAFSLVNMLANPAQIPMSIIGELLSSLATSTGDLSLFGMNTGLQNPLSGLVNSLSHEFSGLVGDASGPSTATGGGVNRGGGPGIPSPAAGAPAPPSSAQLLEQLQASILSPEQRETATTAALNRLSAQTGQNPFTLPGGGLDEPQFADVISSGLARQNEQLTDPVSFGRLSSVFGDENLLKNILTEETGIRREGFTSDLESAFPGDAFGEIDDNIINSIIEERVGPARQQVSNFAARNLSAPGGVGANEFLRQQEETARGRLGEIGGNVQSLNQLGVNAIRDVARSGIRDFELGAGFDVAPFAEQRQSLIGERTGTFGEDVRTQLGSEPLFDVSGALSAGSRAGGLVSGQPQGGEGLLDVIAERELAGRTNRRGLQRSGSGAF